ncbi:alkylated DNA repair dioxygenase AlkB [Rhodanobacter sp. K2T2]|uniref:alpha-ketoglutarate-dependent dioxygenase AlkB family protein n=1 Tax=Rhodanobacter sp. K2T2 TaxID=2723085 RepID=UPI0015CD0D9A|nr:alpha-ketoglutarate-dependent dioxygenase AlkB [Rhodanobacter sp. K2T2]NYE30911.1 alkylated DNA repair dioxygenase AlkB [Rhodanobacter sp. K2T2]
MASSLSKTAAQRIDLPGADITLHPGWLASHEADALYADLLESVAWETHYIKLFGREVASPRLSCWIGDAGTGYTYSRTRFEPRPWPESLASLRGRLETDCMASFNSVLANFYRDGSDSMGWHSDDESELGARPVIASLSLGATRPFRLRRRLPRGVRVQRGDTLCLPLTHGSLLRMAGDTQRLYRHEIPKTREPIGGRINLTFRWIDSKQD